MTNDLHPRFFIWGGISGIIGTLCYIIAITVPMNNMASYILATSWPILSIIFVFSLFRFIELETHSPMNQLAFIFSVLAFVLLTAMISSQVAVRIGIDELIQTSSPNQEEILKLMRRSIRLVDMGIDVAWDIFIGTALMFLAFALKGHSNFGLWWGIPLILLGVLLIAFNVITFPHPPGSRNLVDIGPAIGLYIIMLSGRLAILGNRLRARPPRHSHT
jgi:hypothetical protein